MEFQQRLYDLRKKAGLSQEGLADLLGVTRQAVQKWEAGASRPDMDNLAALARYFNVTLDYLVTGEEPPAPAAQTTIVNNYYQRWRYEYKSQRTLFGLPLVHIRLGDRGTGLAKGVFAVGNYAVGIFTIGGFSLGLVSIGGLSFGLLFALGGWAMGALAIGGLAIGLLAIGGAAAGLFAMGGGPSASTLRVEGPSPRKSPSAAPPTPLWPSAGSPRGLSPLLPAPTRPRLQRLSARPPPERPASFKIS